MTTGLSRQHRQVLGNFHGDLIDILPDFLLIRERQAETHPGFLFTEICERGRSSLVNTSVLFYLTLQRKACLEHLATYPDIESVIINTIISRIVIIDTAANYKIMLSV